MNTKLDSKKYPLYTVARQCAALEEVHQKTVHLAGMKSKLELLNMINTCFERISDVTTVNFSENPMEKQGNNELYLDIDSKDAPYLQSFKEQICQIFAVQHGTDDVRFPDGLEDQLQERKIKVRRHKEQVKEYLKLMNNCENAFI